MAERKSSAKNPTDSREALLEAAKVVFSEKGYEGATVKDLADEAGVNVSLVSYHFGGKEGLYRTCIESFGVARVEAAERILAPAASKEEFRLRLQLWAEHIIEIQQKEGNACRVVMRGMDTLDPISLEVFSRVFHRMFQAFHNYIERARQSGLLKQSLDTEIVAGLMFGALMHQVQAQKLIKALGKRSLEEAPHRANFIEHWVSCHTEGIFA